MLLQRLIEAQEEEGWHTSLSDTQGKAEHFKAGLELLGFESIYVSRNMGSIFIWVILATCSIISIFLIEPFTKGVPCVGRISAKLRKKFLWNSVLRTIMQTSLEFTYASIFTLKYTSVEYNFGILLNIAYAIAFLILTFTFPFIFLLYQMHFEKISDKKFVQESDQTNTEWSIL